MGANGALRGQGEAVRSSSILIAAAVVNMILDPILIYGWGPLPGFGIAGAGYALALAYVTAAAWALVLINRGELRFQPSRCLSGGVLTGVKEIAKVGAPASIANAVNPAGLAVPTGIIATHGDASVAAFGAAGRLQAFSVVPLLALSSAIGPVVGQNWGAGRIDRVRETLRLSGLACVVYGLAVALPLLFLRERIGAIFTDDQTVIDGIALYLLIASWGFFAYGLLIVSNGVLNAIDQSARALVVSVVRVVAIMAPLGWIGAQTLGPEGVFGADLLANLVGGSAAFWLAWRATGRQPREMRRLEAITTSGADGQAASTRSASS